MELIKRIMLQQRPEERRENLELQIIGKWVDIVKRRLIGACSLSKHSKQWKLFFLTSPQNRKLNISTNSGAYEMFRERIIKHDSLGSVISCEASFRHKLIEDFLWQAKQWWFNERALEICFSSLVCNNFIPQPFTMNSSELHDSFVCESSNSAETCISWI